METGYTILTNYPAEKTSLNPPASSSLSTKIRMSFGVSCLLLVFILLAFGGWLRMGLSLRDQAFIREVNALPGVVYLAITGAVWGILGMVSAAGLISRRRWGLRSALSGVILFPLTGWANVLWTSNIQSASLINLPFLIALTIFWLAAGSLILIRADRKGWFISKNDEEKNHG